MQEEEVQEVQGREEQLHEQGLQKSLNTINRPVEKEVQLVLLYTSATTTPLRPRHSCVAATHTRSTIVSFANEERLVCGAGQRGIYQGRVWVGGEG